MNSGRVELPESKELLKQFTGLERRTTRSGKDSIDHGPGGHDDLANSVAGAIVATTGPQGTSVGILLKKRHRDHFHRGG